MDPFTQRMLDRARARQEKINQKLADSGQTPKRKPLTENLIKSTVSPVKSPSKPSRTSISSPRKSINEPVKPVTTVKSPNRPSNDGKAAKAPTKRTSLQKSDQLAITSPQRARNDVIVTRKEFKSPKSSLTRRNSDVSVEINISHRNDIQIEVQVEERDAPITVVYDSQASSGSNVIIEEIEDMPHKEETSNKMTEISEHKTDRGGLRNDTKSRLNRLGNLYSDNPHLSSPIHRTEQEFSSATPPSAYAPAKPSVQEDPQGKKKFGRLAALADQINNWEDDLTHHNFHPEPASKKPATTKPRLQPDESTLDVSIHSINDINAALQSATKSKQTTKPGNSRTFTKQTNDCQRLGKQIVAELEPKRDATPSAVAAPNMAAMVAKPAMPVTKKPSLKKYKAPTPPVPSEDECDSDKDKENNETEHKQIIDEPVPNKGSPLPKRFLPKLNGNVDRNSVLSKAAMFETGSPKAKDPAEMSLRERKALFEKNKGAAIIPKAPFGQAPSTKALHGDNKADKQAAKPLLQPKPQLKSNNTTPTHSRTTSKEEIPRSRTASKEEVHSRTPSKEEIRSRRASKEEIQEDTISQSSLGGGIKGKLAALFSKEQTISESTITNKFKLEREKEMEMLNNRFQYKPQQKPAETQHESDEESDSEPSDKAPLMRSTVSLANAAKKPEIVANVPKVTFEKTKSETALNDEDKDKVIGSQPVKRRSSQDSPVVLAVVDDVKRLKVNNKGQNGAGLYPHLSDIETDRSNSQEEYSDCGGSSGEEDAPISANDKLNKSDNWAETSFGREVMNVVKKNNSSYRKAVRESDSDSSACDSELDDMLDEALADGSEGPTPPKQNKNGLSSASFVYQQKSVKSPEKFKSPEKYKSPDKFKTPEHFKSPLKSQATTPATHRDKGNELVHSVSFYRRMQNASSTPTTPLRVVRHTSPERDTPAAEETAAPVTTVRQRIKELQAEITKQQTVISQASQALNLCAATIEFSRSTEQAEGERLLLLASHRRAASVQEMQRLQVEGAGCAGAAGMASLQMNGLSVPLRRDYVRQLNADGAVGHHAVCLLKCRDRVLATSMQLTQPSGTLLHFPDEIQMDGLTSDFKVTVEVYLLQASKEVLPHDVKYHIFSKKTSSKLLTPKSKASTLKTPAVQSPAGPHAVRTPQFQLHGYCIFALPQATRKNFTLNKVPAGSPLDGSINIDIRARLRVPPPAPHAAFLTAFDDVSGLGAWHRRWFRLQPPRLAYWKYPDDVQKKMPIGDIDLTTVVSDKAVKAPRDLCARPHTILIETSVPAGLIVPDGGSLVYVKRGNNVVRRHLLAADTATDRDVWLDRLNSALEYVRCSSADDE